jgi:rhodanese-related sulfurtransferase
MEINEIKPTEAYSLLQSGALLIDVREADEIAQTAFDIASLKKIPYSTFDENYADISRNQQIVIACHSGIRSLRVAQFLVIQGWDVAKIFNLTGGIAAWKNAKLPTKSAPRTFSFAKPTSSCGCDSDGCC